MKKLIGKDRFFAIISSIFTLIITLIVSKYGIDFHHHGIMYNGAMGILSKSGKLYSNYYYHYGPVTAIIHALAIKLLGFNVYSLNVITCFIYSITSYHLYLLSRKFFNTKISILTLVVWQLLAPYFITQFLPWSSVVILPFFLLLILHSIKPKKNYFFIALMTTLIFFSRQSSGLILILGIVTALSMESKFSDLFKYLKFIFILIISGFVLLYLNGNLTDYFKLSFAGQAFMLTKGNSFEDQLINIVSTFLWTFLGGIYRLNYWLNPYENLWFPHIYYLFAWIIFIFGFINLIIFLRRRRDSKFSIFLFFVSMASISQMYPIACIQHNYWAFTPILPLVNFHFVRGRKFLLINKIGVVKKIVKIGSFVFLSILVSAIFVRVKGFSSKFITKKWVHINLDNHVLNNLYIDSVDYQLAMKLKNLESQKRVVFPANVHGIGQPYLIPYLISNTIRNDDKENFVLYTDHLEFNKIRYDTFPIKYHVYSEDSDLMYLFLSN